MSSQKDRKSDDKQKDGVETIGIVCRAEADSSRKVVIIIGDELAFPVADELSAALPKVREC